MAFGGSLSSMTSEPAFGQIHMVRGTRHFPRLMVGCPVGWGTTRGDKRAQSCNVVNSAQFQLKLSGVGSRLPVGERSDSSMRRGKTVGATVKAKAATDRENRMNERAKQREADVQPAKKRGRSPQPKQVSKRGPSSGKSKASSKVVKPSTNVRSSSRKVVENVNNDTAPPHPLPKQLS